MTKVKFLYKHSRKYVEVKTPKETVLTSIAKYPITELTKLGKQVHIDKYTLSKLKKIARHEAEKETFKLLNKNP